MSPGAHDQLVRHVEIEFGAALVGFIEQFDELVADPEFSAPLLVLAVAAFERYAGALLQFRGHIGIEPFDVCQVLQRHVGHFFE